MAGKFIKSCVAPVGAWDAGGDGGLGVPGGAGGAGDVCRKVI